MLDVIDQEQHQQFPNCVYLKFAVTPTVRWGKCFIGQLSLITLQRSGNLPCASGEMLALRMIKTLAQCFQTNQHEAS